MGSQKISFEENYQVIVHEIEKRRASWTLASLDFDDVKQNILIHVFKQLKRGKFDPQKIVNGRKVEFTHWLQALISSQISNHLRDNLYKWSRPCIPNSKQPYGCPFSTGPDSCSETPSKKQCNECPIYADWERRKHAHFCVKQTLPMEHHAQEAENIQEDFLNIAEVKVVLDRHIMERLSPHERKLYRLLYIKGKSENAVGKLLGYKRVGRMGPGYLIFLALRHKVTDLAKEIIATEGLAGRF